MNRLLTTIPGARGRGPVRVERKIRRRSAEEVRGAGVTAVGDALFRMGGPLSGRDVLRILTTPKPGKGPISSSRITPENPCVDGALTPISTSEKGSGFTPSEAVEKIDIRPGALAADVCRHIWAERGRFAPILYGSA